MIEAPVKQHPARPPEKDAEPANPNKPPEPERHDDGQQKA
jgi:hypothetical protein